MIWPFALIGIASPVVVCNNLLHTHAIPVPHGCHGSRAAHAVMSSPLGVVNSTGGLPGPRPPAVMADTLQEYCIPGRRGSSWYWREELPTDSATVCTRVESEGKSNVDVDLTLRTALMHLCIRGPAIKVDL